MGGYDAAVKVIFSRCREVALKYFLGLKVEESEVIEGAFMRPCLQGNMPGTYRETEGYYDGILRV